MGEYLLTQLLTFTFGPGLLEKIKYIFLGGKWNMHNVCFMEFRIMTYIRKNFPQLEKYFEQGICTCYHQ